MSQLFSQYRPQAWSEVVGQDAALAKINAIRQRGLAGRAWWISGKSGVGKFPAMCFGCSARRSKARWICWAITSTHRRCYRAARCSN